MLYYIRTIFGLPAELLSVHFEKKTGSKPGSRMPNYTKDMRLNPNRDAHSSFSEDVQTNKQISGQLRNSVKLRIL